MRAFRSPVCCVLAAKHKCRWPGWALLTVFYLPQDSIQRAHGVHHAHPLPGGVAAGFRSSGNRPTALLPPGAAYPSSELPSPHLLPAVVRSTLSSKTARPPPCRRPMGITPWPWITSQWATRLLSTRSAPSRSRQSGAQPPLHLRINRRLSTVEYRVGSSVFVRQKGIGQV